MAYVFLSYARADLDYVKRLERFLEDEGIETWFDQEIARGDHWERRLEEKINGCSAFLVVMTPASREARWVSREINQAEVTNHPIFPLLLDGHPFMKLNELQYEDVRGGRMPSREFVEELRQTIDGTDDPGGGGTSARTLSLDSEDEDTFRILKHIYSRATDAGTTFRVLRFLRQVADLGTTIEGSTPRTWVGAS
jgi:hypothetical protein